MKGLKPTVLALCIAGAPPAALAFQPLDETTMGNITGQAGVTIELETKVDIGRFTYTDEGSLAISDISIGGAERTDFFGYNGLAGTTASDRLDNIKIDIDVYSDGDAVINLLPIQFAAVDFRITSGSWELLSSDGSSDKTTLLDNFFAEGVIGRSSIEIDTATDVLNFRGAFAIEVMDFDVPFLAVGVRGLQITGADYDLRRPSPLDLFAEVELDVYKAARQASGGDALAIDMSEFRADVGIEEVIVGQHSIGKVFMDDLAVNNTAMRIYGH
ncbi:MULTISPECIES: DUF6160 family protein [Marinobacter]|jgi:hypothetical protein|uniref:DUF6160 family protein n=1 Tax=Marinobacter TaxID=2742 RepID=UPI00241CBCF5|nr:MULTISPECIES: DUF6160 family protein [Marinobacter]|tara:strand:+ start:687 stop:1502 length:816 start_codon:yes stop_codon:yes gene_type:complete